MDILTVTDRLVKDNGHPSEFIEINNKRVEIDKELIPLIKELNKVGLRTIECCQGGKNTLVDNSLFDAPAQITLELDQNMSCAVKPLGAYGKQRLVIYWKKNGNVLEEST